MMKNIVLMLSLVLPINSHAFNMLEKKNFYITIGERRNSFTQMMSRKYGIEYGMLASVVWHVGEEEMSSSPDYSRSNMVYFTWEF